MPCFITSDVVNPIPSKTKCQASNYHYHFCHIYKSLICEEKSMCLKYSCIHQRFIDYQKQVQENFACVTMTCKRIVTPLQQEAFKKKRNINTNNIKFKEYKK